VLGHFVAQQGKLYQRLLLLEQLLGDITPITPPHQRHVARKRKAGERSGTRRAKHSAAFTCFLYLFVLARWLVYTLKYSRTPGEKERQVLPILCEQCCVPVRQLLRKMQYNTAKTIEVIEKLIRSHLFEIIDHPW
jgi:hypothetical protein